MFWVHVCFSDDIDEESIDGYTGLLRAVAVKMAEANNYKVSWLILFYVIWKNALHEFHKDISNGTLGPFHSEAASELDKSLGT